MLDVCINTFLTGPRWLLPPVKSLGKGGLRVKNSSQYPTHAILNETTHAMLALGVSCASRKTAHVDLINEYNRPDEHSVTLVDVEWDAHEEQVLLAEQFFDVE